MSKVLTVRVRQDRLAAVNPLRQVPTLVPDDGEVRTETAAIALRLADRHAGLAPPPGSAKHRRFLRLLIWMADAYPTFTYGDYPERRAPSAQDKLTDATNAHRKRLYGWLEEQVVGPYALGEQASALDCYAMVMIDWRPGRE